MLDFVMGIGFAFVIEGVIWGLFPHEFAKIVKTILETDVERLRYIGIGSMVVGISLIWYVQHLRELAN